MRTSLSLSLALFALAACAPEEKCSGELYYDGRACRPCPDDAKFEDGRCVCEDSERYRFSEHRCVLRPGAMPEPEPDAGMSSCDDYCALMTGCVGDNPIAMTALSDVVEGLHAGDTADCIAACEDDSAAEGGEEVLECFSSGRSDAACESDVTPAGLERAFTLVAECCAGKSGGLCGSICGVLTSNALTARTCD